MSVLVTFELHVWQTQFLVWCLHISAQVSVHLKNVALNLRFLACKTIFSSIQYLTILCGETSSYPLIRFRIIFSTIVTWIRNYITEAFIKLLRSKVILMKVQSQNDKYHIGARSTEHLISNFMLFVPCLLLQLMQQPTNTRDTIQLMTIINLILVLKENKFESVRALSTTVGTLIVATIYLQLIQNRYMFRSFTVLQCSHQHCVQPVASDVEVVGYL